MPRRALGISRTRTRRLTARLAAGHARRHGRDDPLAAHQLLEVAAVRAGFVGAASQAPVWVLQAALTVLFVGSWARAREVARARATTP